MASYFIKVRIFTRTINKVTKHFKLLSQSMLTGPLLGRGIRSKFQSKLRIYDQMPRSGVSSQRSKVGSAIWSLWWMITQNQIILTQAQNCNPDLPTWASQGSSPCKKKNVNYVIFTYVPAKTDIRNVKVRKYYVLFLAGQVRLMLSGRSLAL